jgi:hypothetical protein
VISLGWYLGECNPQSESIGDVAAALLDWVPEATEKFAPIGKKTAQRQPCRAKSNVARIDLEAWRLPVLYSSSSSLDRL